MECRHEISHTQFAARYDFPTQDTKVPYCDSEYIEEEDFEEEENSPAAYQLRFHDDDFDYMAWEKISQLRKDYAVGF
jgi:hypothetical protein